MTSFLHSPYGVAFVTFKILVLHYIGEHSSETLTSTVIQSSSEDISPWWYHVKKSSQVGGKWLRKQSSNQASQSYYRIHLKWKGGPHGLDLSSEKHKHPLVNKNIAVWWILKSDFAIKTYNRYDNLPSLTVVVVTIIRHRQVTSHSCSLTSAD